MSKADQSSPNPAKRAWRAKLPAILIVAVVLFAGAVAARRFFKEPIDEREQSGVLMNLTSKVGEKAPAFTLTDSEGVAYDVAPGGGTPHVLFFHMGTR